MRVVADDRAGEQSGSTIVIGHSKDHFNAESVITSIPYPYPHHTHHNHYQYHYHYRYHIDHLKGHHSSSPYFHHDDHLIQACLQQALWFERVNFSQYVQHLLHNILVKVRQRNKETAPIQICETASKGKSPPTLFILLFSTLFGPKHVNSG